MGMTNNEICIQDKYDKKILSRRYGNAFGCNNCGRSWIACKDDIIEGYDLYVTLRCPYCHNMIKISESLKKLLFDEMSDAERKILEASEYENDNKRST